MSVAAIADLALVSVAGPKPCALPLESGKPITIGRRSTHALVLDRAEVSRDHAVLSLAGPESDRRWFLTDAGSRHGTRVNGVALEPGRACPIQSGDVLEIAPWVFRVIDRSNRAPSSETLQTLNTLDDGGYAIPRFEPVESAAIRDVHGERVRLLLDCAERIQRAADETSLANAVLDAVVPGTGFPNAAVLRPMRADGVVEALAQRGEVCGPGGAPSLSRTLIRACSTGMTAQLTAENSALRHAVSVADLHIHDAVCVPLLVESAFVGCLYLDSRQRPGESARVSDDAVAFASGVGRLASMALGNIMRRDLERRYARMEGELAAAAVAQRLILPPREGRCGPLQYVGECRPGRIVSGDFFDVIMLGDNRAAVTLGDVAGKGVSASVIMTSSLGFLHGALREHGDAARAVSELNAYLNARAEPGRFTTLWVGVFDFNDQTLTYLNAGHGYAWLTRDDGSHTRLDDEGGPPVGVIADMHYRAAVFALDHAVRVTLVSDGIIEQPGKAADEERSDQFGRARLEPFLNNPTDIGDDVARLFEAVQAHAGDQALADDATVVAVQWSDAAPKR